MFWGEGEERPVVVDDIVGIKDDLYSEEVEDVAAGEDEGG